MPSRSASLEKETSQTREAEVLVHVYDWGTSGFTQLLNSYVEGLGVFHSGVEVHGAEWSFGAAGTSHSGVTKRQPRAHSEHTYRTTVPMGCTKFTPKQVEKLLEVMREKWAGDTYHALHRNCHHFSDTLCGLLGCVSLPGWISGVLQYTSEKPERHWIYDREVPQDSSKGNVASSVLTERAPLLLRGFTQELLALSAAGPGVCNSRVCDGSNDQLAPVEVVASFPSSPDSSFSRCHKFSPKHIVSASSPGSSHKSDRALITGKEPRCRRPSLPIAIESGAGNFGKAEGVFDPFGGRMVLFKMAGDGWHWGDAALDVEMSRPASFIDGPVWQEVDGDDTCSDPSDRERLAACTIERSPTLDAAWRDEISADANVGACPPGGLPRHFARNLGEALSGIDNHEDRVGLHAVTHEAVVHTDRSEALLDRTAETGCSTSVCSACGTGLGDAVSGARKSSMEDSFLLQEGTNDEQMDNVFFDDVDIEGRRLQQSANSAARPQPPRRSECKTNELMLRELRNQVGDLALLRWDSFTLDT